MPLKGVILSWKEKNSKNEADDGESNKSKENQDKSINK